MGRAASILGFGSTSYYHWVLETLPRLLMLREELLDRGIGSGSSGISGGDGPMTLIVPIGERHQPYVKEGMKMVAKAVGAEVDNMGMVTSLPPFTNVTYYNGSYVIGIQELWYLDWHTHDHGPSMRKVKKALPPLSS